jgi:hypothetical protein
VNAEKYGENYNEFRNRSPARSQVTTRVHSARRSQCEPAVIPARTSGREQPSGPGSVDTRSKPGGCSRPRSIGHAGYLRFARGTKRRACSLPLSSQLVSVVKLAREALTETGSSTTGFDEQLSVTELRQPLLFVAAPLAASAVSKSRLTTRVGRRSGSRAHPPRKCHQDVTVYWRSLQAAAEAMTPCQRGVSDLGCGRRRDRRHVRCRGRSRHGCPEVRGCLQVSDSGRHNRPPDSVVANRQRAMSSAHG